MAAKNDTLRLPVQIRSERFRSYDVNDFAPATNRDQEWKNTPLDRAEPLMGELDGSRYSFGWDAPAGVTTQWVPRDNDAIGATGLIPEDVISANAWTQFGEALVVSIPDGHQTVGPLWLTRSDLGDTPRALHTVIHAGADSTGFVVLDYRGTGCIAENVEIVADPTSRLTVVSVEDWAPTAVHGGAVFVSVAAQAEVTHIQVSLGGDFIRINPTAVFRGPRGRLTLDGVYFADAGQHIEHQVYIDHDAPDCYSRVTYKGALQGKGAHTVWIGDALIRSHATGTDTYELNRNLVLTRGAHSDSVPNLEIETGEIIGAGHASATGRFDDEQLFYPQSRGITEVEARRLVVRGFLMQIVQEIGQPELEKRIADALEAELSHTVI